MSKKAKGCLCALLSAVIYGCNPLAARLIYADGLNYLMLIFFRNSLSIPFYFIALLRNKESIWLKREDRLRVALLAVLDGCFTQPLLVASYNYLPSSVATALHFIYPSLVIIESLLFFGKKTNRWQMLGVILCTTGIVLLCKPDNTVSVKGGGLALLSGFSYAGYIVLFEYIRPKDMSVIKLNFYILTVTSFVLLPMCIGTGKLVFPSSIMGGFWCLVYSILASICGMVLFQKATILIGGQRTAILSAFEPITSLVVGAAVFHETLGHRSYVAIGCVIIATVMVALFDKDKKQKNEG